MINHNSEALLRFRDLGFFDASCFQHFNCTVKTFVIMKSMKKYSSTKETVKAMNSSVEDQYRRDRNNSKN